MKTVGIIGLGEMGLPMAGNLVGRGFEVTGYDIRADACRDFQASGGRTAPSSGEAARDRDAVVIMVRTAAQAE